MDISFADLTRLFLYLGAISVGGKATTAPIFQELVIRRAWVTSEEFAEAYAMAKVLPGPTASTMLVSLMLQRRGALVAAYCLLLFALPGSVVILALTLVMFHTQLPYWLAAGLAGAATAGIGVLMAITARMTQGIGKARLWPVFLLAAFSLHGLLHVDLVVVLLGLTLASLGVNLAAARPPTRAPRAVEQAEVGVA